MSLAQPNTEAPLPAGSSNAVWSSLRYLGDPYGFLHKEWKKHGDPFTLPTLQGMLVITGDPAHIRTLMAADPDGYASFNGEGFKDIVGGNSLIVLSGAPHKAARKLLTPPFHGARMRAYGHLMRAVTIAQTEGWPVDRPFTLQKTTQAISLDVIIQAVFGVSEPSRMAVARRIILAIVRALRPSLFLFPFLRHEFGGLGPWAQFQRLMQEMQDLVSAEIAMRRAETHEREDILSLLLAARFEDGRGLDERAIMEHLMTLLIAGHETTAVSLTWAMYWLHRYPEALERLRAEIDALGPEAEPEDIAKLPFLEAVCHETLRLYPIAPVVARRLLRPFHLGGYELPAGCNVAAGVALVHAREELYPEPNRFRPERFLERTYAPHEFLPFGGGHRRCIGAAFALYEMKIVLATLVARFHLCLASDRPVVPEVRITTTGPKGGVKMVLRERRRLAH